MVEFESLIEKRLRIPTFRRLLQVARLDVGVKEYGEKEREETKERKHHYKINRNLSLGFMKDKIVEILMKNDENYMEELKELFKIEPVPIRDGRNFPRIDHGPRKKYHMNKKKAI